MRVLKFGGTSVGSPAALRQVTTLVAAAGAEDDVIVVVSALAGVTDRLVVAAAGGEAGLGTALLEQHLGCLAEVADGDEAAAATISRRCRELEELLGRLERGGPARAEIKDAVVATGERLAAPLVAAALRTAGTAAVPVDGGELLITDSVFGAARVDMEATAMRCRTGLAALPGAAVPVVTGFVAADRRDRTTTLGRGGSDLSAAVIGTAIRAGRVEIWSDVDGVLAGPPDLVPGAAVLGQVSFAEAAVLASLGTKVLHPATVAPLAAVGIPLVVRNTFNPRSGGTLVQGGPDLRQPPVRAVTARVGLLRLSLPQVAPADVAAVLGRLAEQRVETVAVASAEAGETTVLVAPGSEDGVASRLDLRLTALGRGGEGQLGAWEGVAVVAAVGPFAAASPATLSRVLSCLAGSGVTALSVAPGGWPHAVAVLVTEEETAAAVRALHEELVRGREEAAAPVERGALPGRLAVVEGGQR